MAELINCPDCDRLFVKISIRAICEVCYKKEETAFDKVYRFIRKRENRLATIIDVINATGVEEKLIYKFIKTGRIRATQFPNFGYPCQKCGALIKDGKLCTDCKNDLTKQLAQFEKSEHLEQELKEREKGATYYSRNK
jgi:flagellar operon protein (TIGR03826 family)